MSVDPDAFLEACPSRQLLMRIGEKWTLMAVVALAEGPVRFGGLRRRLEGVSQKMLAQTLRHLERDGLVTRTVVERPLRVDYALTDRGRSLVPLAGALKAWAEGHLHSVLASNRAFDARIAKTPAENVVGTRTDKRSAGTAGRKGALS